MSLQHTAFSAEKLNPRRDRLSDLKVDSLQCFPFFPKLQQVFDFKSILCQNFLE